MLRMMEVAREPPQPGHARRQHQHEADGKEDDSEDDEEPSELVHDNDFILPGCQCQLEILHLEACFLTLAHRKSLFTTV